MANNTSEPVLTGDLWVGAVKFSKGVKLSTVQAAINRSVAAAKITHRPEAREGIYGG